MLQECAAASLPSSCFGHRTQPGVVALLLMGLVPVFKVLAQPLGVRLALPPLLAELKSHYGGAGRSSCC